MSKITAAGCKLRKLVESNREIATLASLLVFVPVAYTVACATSVVEAKDEGKKVTLRLEPGTAWHPLPRSPVPSLPPLSRSNLS